MLIDTKWLEENKKLQEEYEKYYNEEEDRWEYPEGYEPLWKPESEDKKPSKETDQMKAINDIAEVVANAVNDAIAGADQDSAVDVTVTVSDTPKDSKLISPITFTGEIADDGSLVGEEANTMPTPTATADFSNPYIARINSVPPCIDNAGLLNVYPQLISHVQAIAELGLGCALSLNSYGLIEVAVMRDRNIDPGISYTVDMNGIVLGNEYKWINCYQPSAGDYDTYFCIDINNIELLKQYMSNTVTSEDLKKNALYRYKYIASNQLVDLKTMPKVHDEIKYRVIDRIFKAIKAKVFEGQDVSTGKFIFKNLVDATEFELVKGNVVVSFGRDNKTTVTM